MYEFCNLHKEMLFLFHLLLYTYCGTGKSDLFPESVTIQPCVASTYTKVTETPLVDKFALSATPPILEPFLSTVILFVAKVYLRNLLYQHCSS
jgi:hypothetical protein